MYFGEEMTLVALYCVVKWVTTVWMKEHQISICNKGV